jgi:hypothetical protein
LTNHAEEYDGDDVDVVDTEAALPVADEDDAAPTQLPAQSADLGAELDAVAGAAPTRAPAFDLCIARNLTAE